MKTSELSGPALDWAVAMALGWLTYPTDSVERGEWYHTNPAIAPRGYEHNRIHIDEFRPSTDWAQAGPIIERERLQLNPGSFTGPGRLWVCWGQHWHGGRHSQGKAGPTPLIAAMRCFVASKLGDEIEIPKEIACLQSHDANGL